MNYSIAIWTIKQNQNKTKNQKNHPKKTLQKTKQANKQQKKTQKKPETYPTHMTLEFKYFFSLYSQLNTYIDIQAAKVSV